MPEKARRVGCGGLKLGAFGGLKYSWFVGNEKKHSEAIKLRRAIASLYSAQDEAYRNCMDP
jgi:hypothetical protein